MLTYKTRKTSNNINNSLVRVLWIKNNNGLEISLNSKDYTKIINYHIQDIIENNSNVDQIVYHNSIGNDKLIIL